MYVELGIDFDNPGYKFFTEKEFKEYVLKYVANLGITEVPIIKFHNEEGSLGYCIMKLYQRNTQEDDESIKFMKQFTNSNFSTPLHCAILSFNKNLLDGQTYVLSQVQDTIIHELAHMVAYRKYKVDCDHDERWKEIAINFGSSGDEILGSGEAFYKINPSPVNDIEIRNKKYYIYCRKCGKLHAKTNDPDAFVLFILSCANLGISLTFSFSDIKNFDIETKSECCNSDYKLIASAEDLLASIDAGFEEMGWRKENTPSIAEAYNEIADIIKKNS